MANTTKRPHEIATIDCELITITPQGSDVEYALNTASKIAVEPQSETTDAIKLVIKGVLKAQKHKRVTITGNQITLTDNVFTPEIVKILQGGTITTDGSSGKITKYVPPKIGSDEKLPIFTLTAYSAIYNAAGVITGYEKITYPNCQGNPISLSSEDDVFRVNEYTIDSAPDTGEAPYELEYIDTLPTISETATTTVESATE